MPIPRSLFNRDDPVDHDFAVVGGAWPEGLSGELVLSAPHPDTFGGPHPFFGDGVMYRLSLQPGTHGAPPDRFAWRARRIDSPSARLRAQRPDVFTPTMIGVSSPFGHSNAANTAPLVWGDRLFTTWDVGRPVEVDPVTLEFLGEVGHRNQWKSFEALGPQPVLPMIMSTAHPVIDPERNVLWTVNTVWGQLHIVRWDGTGDIEMWPVDGAVIPQSVHTITQTRDWLVVGDCAYKFEAQVLDGGDRTKPANADGPVFLIRKADIESTQAGHPVTARRFTIGPEINHYYATWDDSDGVAVLFEHTESADIAMVQSPHDTDALGRPCDPALAGLYGFPMAPDRTSMVVVNPDTGAVLHRAEQCEPGLLWSRQLNAMDWSLEGRNRPTLHHSVHQGYRPEAITQKMLALYGDRVDQTILPNAETAPVVASTSVPDMELASYWELGVDDFPSSPIFVPRNPSAGLAGYGDTGENPGGHDGWVVVPVCNDNRFRIEVFDAADVGRGPVATLAAGSMTAPFMLHSAWIPRAVASTPLPRVRFADELDRVDELPSDLAHTARQVADDLVHGAPLV
jgi:carotenoid cleavage dioxygenase-like enzyme